MPEWFWPTVLSGSVGVLITVIGALVLAPNGAKLEHAKELRAVRNAHYSKLMNLVEGLHELYASLQGHRYTSEPAVGLGMRIHGERARQKEGEELLDGIYWAAVDLGRCAVESYTVSARSVYAAAGRVYWDALLYVDGHTVTLLYGLETRNTVRAQNPPDDAEMESFLRTYQRADNLDARLEKSLSAFYDTIREETFRTSLAQRKLPDVRADAHGYPVPSVEADHYAVRCAEYTNARSR